MKTSITTAGLDKYICEKRAIELIAQAGFDGVDFNFGMVGWDWYKDDIYINDHPFAKDDYLNYAREMKRVAKENGLIINQTHAPAPTKPKVEEWVKRAIECTAEMESEYVIVHLYTDDMQYNVDLMNKFIPIAKACGVKLAIENIWHYFENGLACGPIGCNEHSLNGILDILNDDSVVACIDTGHAAMAGLDTSPEKIINARGKRVKTLHVHDNDLKKDLHLIPFTKDIDFVAVAKALKNINYSGYITLESIFAGNESSTEQDIKEYLAKAQAAAKRISDIIQKA